MLTKKKELIFITNRKFLKFQCSYWEHKTTRIFLFFKFTPLRQQSKMWTRRTYTHTHTQRERIGIIRRFPFLNVFMTVAAQNQSYYSLQVKIPKVNYKEHPHRHTPQCATLQANTTNSYINRVRNLTLLARRGESFANHVSCLSVWQWAKHELINNPFSLDDENSFTELSIWFLNPALQSKCAHILWKLQEMFFHRKKDFT